MNNAPRLAAAFLLLVAAAHLLRFLFGIRLIVGPINVPIWASLVVVVLTAALAVGLLREKKD